MSLRDALSRGRSRLAQVEDPAREARVLLAHAAGLSQDAFHRLDDADLTPAILERLEAALDARAGGRPLARILGHRDFWKHRFVIDDSVLDPRADTEALVARALEVEWDSVLDLGTGSGCIVLSLLAERVQASGMGTDLSEVALSVARANAARIGVSERVRWQCADWYAGIDGRFDLIVSNPPYIAANEMADLSKEVRDHDPAEALTDHRDGLSAYRAIAAGAAAGLAPGGWLMVEIGWRQRADVSAIFAANGLTDIACHPDMEGRDRVVSARLA